MREFKIDSCKAIVKSSSIRSKSVQPTGPDAEAQSVVETEATLEIDVTEKKDLRNVEFLFPHHEVIAAQIAGMDMQGDGARGEERKADRRLPPLNITVAYNGKDVLVLKECSVGKATKMKTDSKGVCKIILKPRVKLSEANLIALAGLHGGVDIRVTAVVAQTDLTALPAEDAEAEKPKRGKKKPADLTLVEGGEAAASG